MARDLFEIRTEVKRISRHLNILSDKVSGRAEKQDMDAEQVFIAIDELRNNMADVQALALNLLEGTGTNTEIDPDMARKNLRAQFREVGLLVDVVRRRGASTSRLVNDILTAASEIADHSDHLAALDRDLDQLGQRQPELAEYSNELTSAPLPNALDMASDDGESQEV
jgi:methyl-accepting chemotaxis protein